MQVIPKDTDSLPSATNCAECVSSVLADSYAQFQSGEQADYYTNIIWDDAILIALEVMAK